MICLMILKREMCKMLSIVDKDKMISFENKTFIKPEEIRQCVRKIVEEKDVSVSCALRTLVNWAIDKKVETAPIYYKRSGVPVNKFVNFEELLKNEVIEDRKW